MQRARNGRGAQRKHIGRGAKRKQPLLVLHAKSLLLVHHHQTKIGEANILGQQSVRANDQVNAPRLKIFKNYFLLRVAFEAAQTFNAKWIGAKSIAKCSFVLLRQERGGYQHRDLPTRLHALERGANGHLRFSKSNIAANQTIHWLG